MTISNDTIETWEDLDCKTEVLRGIFSYGFEKPSPIQKIGIIPMIQKKDIIAQAQSGTGKTGCFTIGVLENIDTKLDYTQAIILSPTRELSMQIKSVIDGIGSYMKKLRTEILIGGISTDETIKNLHNNPHIIVGCPGKVFDMLRRKKLSFEHLKMIVLDEADEMLSSGFKEQVYNIFQYLPYEIQIALFSATIPNDLLQLTNKFLRNPHRIDVKPEQLTLEGIKQYYVALDNDIQKYETLKDLYEKLSMSQCIIYCNSIKRVKDLYEAMTHDDFPVCQIHSGMDREQRTKNYNDFKQGVYRILISSNVTARGIDIQQVSIVINFDICNDVHTYIHRIGRSGRWGRKGVSINFITKREYKKNKEIEAYYNTEIQELPANWNGD